MNKLIILTITLFFAGSTFAQQQLSLADAIALALKNNYDILVVKNDQAIAENNNSWGRAGAYPTLNFQTRIYNQWALGNEARQHTVTPGINLSWTLFSGFRISTTKKRLEDLEGLAKASAQQQVENTIRNVIVAYYNALLQRERLAVNEQVMKLSSDRFSAAKTRKELGAAVTFDLLQAKNDYLSDSANFISQKQTHQNALRQLNFLLADTAQVAYELSEEFSHQEESFLLEDLLTRMKQNNQMLKLQQFALAMAEKDIKIAKSSIYPTLSMSAGINDNYQYIVQQLGEQFVTTEIDAFSGNLSATLSWTIFNGGNRKRDIQNAKMNRHSSELSLKQIEHSLTNQITNELQTYEVRKQLLNVAIEAEESAKLNLQIARGKFERGAINSFNYRDVQNIYLNTAQGRLIAVYNLISSRTELMRLIGEIVK